MANESWALEVVKGKEIGRVFPVGSPSLVLGNGLNGEPGIDLGPQEGASPRRMAARQAKLERGPNGLTLADLDSPGGTFVNRQRILSGQTRRLELGDVIQLGGVQLKVVKQDLATPTKPTAAPTSASAPTAAAKTGPLSAPYTMADGSICRTWDDFLLASSKSWSALRGELTSGKLETFLRANGHAGLLPTGAGASTSDERLDAWLGALPTARPSLPELDVHPSTLRVKATPGGGVTRVKLVVTNVGYRLLRSKLRVERAEDGILRIAPEWTSKPFTTAEQTEIPIEVEIPESIAKPVSAFLVVESNGGERRIEVRIEPTTVGTVEPPPEIETGAGISDFLAEWPKLRRIGIAVPLAFALRAALSFQDQIFPSATPRESLLSTLAIAFVIGAALGAFYGYRKAGIFAFLTAAVASGIASAYLATLLQALRRAVDDWFAFTGSPAIISCLLWSLFGLLIADFSCNWIPPRSRPLKEAK